jgi:hypothetical protein
LNFLLDDEERKTISEEKWEISATVSDSRGQSLKRRLLLIK